MQLCLESLFSQDTEYIYEVIVVDNDSENIKYLIELYDRVKWIFNAYRNPYSSRNLGIKEAKGRIIGFLDAKCRPEKYWLQCAMKLFLKSEKTIVAGSYTVIPYSDKLEDQVYGLLYLNNKKNVALGYGVTTGNLFVPKRAFDSIGLFREDNISGNDIEWSKRASTLGFCINYLPEAKVQYAGQSFAQLKKSIKKYMSGIAIQNKTFARHFFTIITYLLPMRLPNFIKALEYRQLHLLPWSDKWYLWLKVWNIKSRMAIAYFLNLLK